MGAGHKKAHALWEQEGRPAEFTVETCATDDDFGSIDRIKKAKTAMENIDAIISAAVARHGGQKPN